MPGPPGPTSVPDRPDEAPSAIRRHRRWLPPLAVAGVILLVTMGGWVLAAALAQPAGPPVGFAGVVAVQPLSGWQDAGRDEVAGTRFVRLTRGGGNLDIVAVVPFAQGPRELATGYVDRVLRTQLSQLSVSNRTNTVSLEDGTRGLRFTYVGVATGTSQSIEGEVTAVVTRSGNGVVFDGWAPEGLLVYAQGDLHTMIFRAGVS